MPPDPYTSPEQYKRGPYEASLSSRGSSHANLATENIARDGLLTGKRTSSFGGHDVQGSPYQSPRQFTTAFDTPQRDGGHEASPTPSGRHAVPALQLSPRDHSAVVSAASHHSFTRGAPMPSPRSARAASHNDNSASGTAMLGGFMPSSHAIRSPRKSHEEFSAGAGTTAQAPVTPSPLRDGHGGTATQSPSQRAKEFVDRIQEPLLVSPRIHKPGIGSCHAPPATSRNGDVPAMLGGRGARPRPSRRLWKEDNPPAFLSMSNPMLDNGPSGMSVSQGVPLEGEVMLPCDSFVSSSANMRGSVSLPEETEVELGVEPTQRWNATDTTAAGVDTLTVHLDLSSVRCVRVCVVWCWLRGREP
jgi:hypothetical protein